MGIKVAILGASGFIGSRTVEILHLRGLAEVRPIVRSFASLARLSRFDLDWRIADAHDQSALRRAFEGCDVVVHSVVEYSRDSKRTILGTVATTYEAAQEAGVRRLIYLSTASVHGQAPSHGTNESSALSVRQPIPYNNYKVQAERKFLKLRRKGAVELVMLRPAIVTGPRSFWITRIADELLSGTAYLVNGGMGVCNTIYIDNLVHAIRLGMTAADVDGHAFLVGDQEQVTWCDFYSVIANALGIEMEQVPHVDYPILIHTWKNLLQACLKKVRGPKLVKTVLPSLAKLKHRAVAALSNGVQTAPPSRWRLPSQYQPTVTQEMALLHRCQYKLPFEKARKILGYEPIVSFDEACRRSIGWMAFVGYPVVSHMPEHIGVREYPN